jgi:hypothetical protein
VATRIFASANVSGLFFVSMEIQDHLGRPLSNISARTQGARHVVRVENVSSLTQNARVFASLPNGKRRIEFVGRAGAIDTWNDVRNNIASGAIVDLDFPLRRNSGPHSPAEPIQIDDVQDSVGTLVGNPATCGVPFTMTIAAN